MIATDEYTRLARLITLTPPGERRAQYEAQLNQIATKPSGNGELTALYAERDRLLARWEKGLDFLAGLRERTGQDTPEFARYFAVWEQIDADLRRVLDRIECAELTCTIVEGQ
jgi:hypothetical protein